jgi:benzoyl-CoA reductase subunit B
MTENKKKKAINRLKTMHPLRANIDEAYKRSVEATKDGKPTAWSMVNWWQADPILKAMDIEIVYPENYGAVCAAFGAAQHYLDRSDEEGFPTHMCGYARNGIGYAAEMQELGEIPPDAPLGGMPKPIFMLCSSALCDARIKWFQSLGRYLDAPVYTVELPHPGVEESRTPGVRDRDINFMVEGLRDLIGFLERLTGRKMNWSRLEEITNELIEINRIWYQINQFRKAKPCPMHSRDFWSCMNASLYPAGDTKVALKLYQDMYSEVEDRVHKKVGAVENEKYRMVFGELPPWHALNIFDELAQRGWTFVIESWAYHAPKPIDYSGIADPLRRIATQTYQWLTGYFEDALKTKEYMGYFAYPYIKWAETYQCDGALFHPLLTCRTATNHLILAQDRLLNKIKVPSLIAEGDIVDLKLFDFEDTMRKAQVLEEMMDYYKHERKEAGFAW